MSADGPIRDLSRLLSEMRPRLSEGTFVFAAWREENALPSGAIAWFNEAEGLSVVLPAEQARTLGLAFDGELAWITLDVHSALDAVGLTAAVSASLAAEGIPCNVIAALRHDHLFVPVARARDALRTLEALTAAPPRRAEDAPAR